ncbi:PEP-CTERM sorting domain-containing protein [Massilia aquatica]|uniref:PEP-CTERM sorting domain-containing protein n=1 Tax=Massilia aquatica TaxID=2609000 RepID=A0ABX0MQJ2_9BURK|nr:PEP-CTERM sorting domain-containing protein [Massilia aquatica]NHZ44481.1 PEP-CTERM sorting domain-containing protein [Massilia aquatica]
MHQYINKRTLCALAALAAAWAPAQANTSTSSASIEQFQYRLVDLDLNDGIDASITFGTDVRSLYTAAGGQSQQLNASGSTSFVSPLGSAGGTLSDSALLAHASMTHTVPYDDTQLRFSSRGTRVTEFILSPNTELILTAVGKVEQQLDGRFYLSGSQVHMRGSLSGDEGTWRPKQFSKNYELGYGSGSATVNLYGSLISDSKARKGEFTLLADSYLMGPVTPVPEPSTYAMLLAGTFVLGAAARRRRKAAADPAA